MPRKTTRSKPAMSQSIATKRKSSKPMAATVAVKKKNARRSRGFKGAAKASILASLASGPKTRQQLIEAGAMTVSSFYLNLKQLQDEKQIVVGGRGGLVQLIKTVGDESSAAKPQKASLPALRARPASSMTVIPQFVSGPLHDALEAVNARFVAVERIGEKLHTLEQLSRTLPSPVAEVLMAVHSDLMKMSPARTSA